jgi:outer membrane protein assembly factor BamB
MRLNSICNKSISLLCVLLLILTFNFTTNVSADFEYYTDDGVAFDNFEDDNDVTLENCNLSNGVIILEEGNPTVKYDKEVTSNKVDAWEISQWVAKQNGGEIMEFLRQFVNPDSPLIPKDEFTKNFYNKIKADDGNTVVTETLIPNIYAYYPMHQFRFKTDYKRNLVDNIYIEWNFGPYMDNDVYNLEELTMYAWNYEAIIPRWEDIAFKEYDPDLANLILGSYESSRYLSDEGYVDIIVVGTPYKPHKTSFLASDYVKIEVTLIDGYFPKGTVTSEVIEPSNLHGWESLIWTGSRPSTYTNIKVRVLDSSGNVIDSLYGNKEGFTISPIDLSSLNIDDYSGIRLKANLTSTSIAFSPRLYGWGVLWQTKDGFKDSFTNTFRIQETNGVKIEDGNVKVSEFYSDWEIFGKDSSNTRSYIGPTDPSDAGQIYWISDTEDDYGGGFRSSVVYNGVMYIASNDSRIYAFNLTADNPWDEQKFQNPFDQSQKKYNVESSLAVGEGKVVFGSCNRNVRDNKIYALDAYDLSIELENKTWSYPPAEVDNTEPICFSASPTIANDRVFITSCNGMFFDPFTSLIWNQINTMLRSIPVIGSQLDFYKTNWLYALDLQTGDPIWNPVRLPASSYSTPAVDNGLIFVGCDNLNGPSLLCYDENSGQLIWNASVGLIGRSSPVVGEINNTKAVFVIGRDKTITSFSGKDTIYAFDAESGELLWNFTFKDNSTSIWPLLLGYGFNNYAPLGSPLSTPTYHNGFLYVLSQSGILYSLDVNNNGREKWSFDINEGGKLIGSFFPAFHCASPLVVNETLYVVNENSYIYALDINDPGRIIWDHNIADPRYVPPGPNNLLFSSPVVTDKLLVASTIEERRETGIYEGRMYVIGNFTRNENGRIISIPIHVQKGKWWNEFLAVGDTNGTNTITYSILDENGKPFSGMSNLNGKNNDISDIKENVIQLSASLKYEDETAEEPVLKRWEISWTLENEKPEFIDGSFRAGEGQQGWINLLNIPECSIEVRDIGVGDVTSGLDVDSARFTLEYVPKDSDNPITEEFDAECEDESGITRTRIIAKISELDIEFKDLRNISFYIRDLAQNEQTSETIEFKIDSGIPSSEIQNTDNYKEKYNNPVRVNATGQDDNSGIASIALYYIEQDDTDWAQYGLARSPFEWEFYRTNSSYYNLCTIAKDYAGNTEAFPDEGDVSFYYDQNEPDKPEFAEEYSFNSLPKFDDITFIDDYKLQKIEYRLFENWIEIASNIESDIYSDEFTISQNDWNNMVEDIEYHMYFRITDFCGNKYETQLGSEALSIKKDVTPPVADIQLDISDFAGGGWKETYTIIADIFMELIEDFDSASLEYQYSADKEKWSKWEQYEDNLTSEPFEWKFKAEDGSGHYRFKIKIYDAAGGFTESKPETVSITIFPTISLILMIILMVILIFATFTIRKRLKMKK